MAKENNTQMPAPAAVVTGPKFSGVMVDVTIHRDGSHDGKEPVALGVEGRVLRIMRGEKVAIPLEHFLRLEQCRYEITDQFGEVVGTVPRFSYTVHGEVPVLKAAA